MGAVSAAGALRLVLHLAGVGVILTSLEYLIEPDYLSPTRLMSADVARLRDPRYVSGLLGCVVTATSGRSVMHILFDLRLAAGVVLVVPWTPGPVDGAAAVMAALVMNLMVVRCPYGLDGADQMYGLVLLAAGIASLLASTAAAVVALSFVASQAGLAYATAGWAKLVAPDWRSGTALAAVLATRMYGMAGTSVASRATSGPMPRMAGRAVIAFEVGFVPLLILSPWSAVTLLAFGLTFHIANAVMMGLSSFVWAFLATYPALWFVALHLHLLK